MIKLEKRNNNEFCLNKRPCESRYSLLSKNESLVLKKANQAFLGNPLLREKLSPQNLGEKTANGTYALFTLSGPLIEDFSQLDEVKVEKSFILKPAAQEMGTIGNPQGNQILQKNGVRGGECAIRERFASSLQKHIGVDFGVPFTEVIAADHVYLSSFFGATIALIDLLNKQLGVNLVFDAKAFKNVKSFEEALSLVFTQMESLVPLGKKREFEFYKDVFSSYKQNQKVSRPELIKLSKKNEINLQTASYIMSTASKLLTYFTSASSEPTNMASIQQIVQPTFNYAQFEAEEIEKIPDSEMHKLIFDLLIFNGDRHMNNILFKKEGSDLQLVLIDHGLSLPRPEGGTSLQDFPRYEWIHYPQFEHRLAEPFASAILNLDIDEFVNHIQADQALLEKEHGSLAAIPEECFTLLRLNLHLLQVGIKLGVSVREMALFQMTIKEDESFKGGEIVNFYKQHIGSKPDDEIDWSLIDKELIKILSKE